MHQFGGSQNQWKDLALWLQTGVSPAGAEWLPPLPDGATFAVLTFDFRGHGESEGTQGVNLDVLADAQTALAFAKTQPGVDPNRILTIGTSIGSDTAVDACVRVDGTAIAPVQEFQGCLGAMSLSPGSYFGVDYVISAQTLLETPHSAVVYCLAAENDGPSPTTCNAIVHDRFRSIIYPGSTHGVSFLKPGFDPEVGQLILEFLLESLQLIP
jgi:dienelactone hydrolase